MLKNFLRAFFVVMTGTNAFSSLLSLNPIKDFDDVVQFAFGSEDESLLVFYSDPKAPAVLYDLPNFQVKERISNENTDHFMNMYVGPKNKLIAIQLSDNKNYKTQIRDLATGSLVSTISQGALSFRLYDVAISNDQQLIAFLYADTRRLYDSFTIKIFDVATGNLKNAFFGRYTLSDSDKLSFSFDAKKILLHARNTFIADLTDGNDVKIIDGRSGRNSISFDGKRIVIAMNTLNTPHAKIYDLETADPIASLMHREISYVVSAAYSPSGYILTSSNSGTVKLWDGENYRELLTIKTGFIGVKFDTFIGPYSDYIFVVNEYDFIKVYDIKTGRQILDCFDKGGFDSQSEIQAISRQFQEALLTNEPAPRVNKHLRHFKLSPSERYLAFGKEDGRLEIFSSRVFDDAEARTISVDNQSGKHSAGAYKECFNALIFQSTGKDCFGLAPLARRVLRIMKFASCL